MRPTFFFFLFPSETTVFNIFIFFFLPFFLSIQVQNSFLVISGGRFHCVMMRGSNG